MKIYISSGEKGLLHKKEMYDFGRREQSLLLTLLIVEGSITPN